MSEHDSDPAVKDRAAEVAKSIERNGALGLRYALERVAEVQDRARHDTLRQLVFGAAQ